MWIPNIALIDIPEPFLIPKDKESVGEAIKVEGCSPHVFTEFDKSGRLVLASSKAPPSFDLTLCHI